MQLLNTWQKTLQWVTSSTILKMGFLLGWSFMDHRASQKRGRHNETEERIKKRWKAVETHCAVHFSLRLQFFRMTKAVIHKDCEKPSFKNQMYCFSRASLTKMCCMDGIRWYTSVQENNSPLKMSLYLLYNKISDQDTYILQKCTNILHEQNISQKKEFVRVEIT